MTKKPDFFIFSAAGKNFEDFEVSLSQISSFFSAAGKNFADFGMSRSQKIIF
uniref:Uncharacterized protein n=1 Tax=Meloidogyne enterolobii TaxID=390850 RepID=A0A6V7V259_MELEN|nr:unnamed protein product [Meloidogyne enterolobii]